MTLRSLRSIFKYCFVTWTKSLTVYLHNKIKRVQKRVLLILLPNAHYNDALSRYVGSRSLTLQAKDLCLRVWRSIHHHPESIPPHLLPPRRSNSPPCNLHSSANTAFANEPYRKLRRRKRRMPYCHCDGHVKRNTKITFQWLSWDYNKKVIERKQWGIIYHFVAVWRLLPKLRTVFVTVSSQHFFYSRNVSLWLNRARAVCD